MAVKVADSPMGKILIGTSGTTLYGFANDTAAKSTCYGACANAWPPVIVDDSWTVGPGLDSGVFSTITRDDGTQQLVAGKFPLYEYAGDAAPGDINGQGSGDVWFVVGTDAKFITSEAHGSDREADGLPDHGTEADAGPGPGSRGRRIGEARGLATRQDHGRRRRPHVVRVHEGRQRRADVRRRLRQGVAGVVVDRTTRCRCGHRRDAPLGHVTGRRNHDRRRQVAALSIRRRCGAR